jgi:hypothetical protein
MTANLSDWQVVSLGIKADEEGKVRVAVHSERVTQLGEPSRTLNDTNSARQYAACGGHNLTLRSKNLCLVGAWNSHAPRVA